MLCEVEDTSKVEKLFEGWQETLIYSCLQKVMGSPRQINEGMGKGKYRFSV